MSLPSRDNILTMDYSFQAQPYVQVPAKSSITLGGIDYSFQAQPFEGIEFPVSNISKVSGVAESSIKKISGVAIGSIKKVSGVQEQ